MSQCLTGSRLPGGVMPFASLGRDVLRGGLGYDVPIGGGDADVFLAGLGRDVVRASDGEADRRISCEKGVDVAIVDALDSPEADCELVAHRAWSDRGFSSIESLQDLLLAP